MSRSCTYLFCNDACQCSVQIKEGPIWRQGRLNIQIFQGKLEFICQLHRSSAYESGPGSTSYLSQGSQACKSTLYTSSHYKQKTTPCTLGGYVGIAQTEHFRSNSNGTRRDSHVLNNSAHGVRLLASHRDGLPCFSCEGCSKQPAEQSE